MGSNRKSPELADGGLLKGVAATSIVPLHLTLSLALCLTDHIRFYAELSWECSAKSVSISRPQSSSVWVRLLMIVQEMYFWARQGDRGSQWCSWLRGLSCERHTDTHSFLKNSEVSMQRFNFHLHFLLSTFIKDLEVVSWLHNSTGNIRFPSIWSQICKSVLLRLVFSLSCYDWGS